ncbi:adenylyl cyclase [Sphingomonas azotifigens]|uniref:adenylyl cyclase n=1 Tax=Sphingomonas azotifigens TaxID=330920 RepID=UPI000A068399|nr:adenylyl cyclase [Sphingomonas azotifigens]
MEAEQGGCRPDAGRRAVIRCAGGAGLAAVAVAAGMAQPIDAEPNMAAGAAPDFGPNVLVLDPSMPGREIQAAIDAIFACQEAAHFTDRRYAILFRPGRYTADVKVGFFTQVLGLGGRPGAVTIDGHVRVNADWLKGDALANFWRGAENLTVRPPEGWDRWAVSQAAPYRRIHMLGDLVLDDGGSSSGGFLADCRIEGTVHAGSQQQWYSRSSRIGGWKGVNWNMMFQGVEGAPATSFPRPAVTTLLRVPLLREKPFLQVDGEGRWSVFVPALRRDAEGPSWASGTTAGVAIPLTQFFIAKPGMDAATLNAALGEGRHLLFTPGVYRLDAPIRVQGANRVLLGIGLATLQALAGTAVLEIDDVPGVTVAGLMIDAGATRSPVLVQVGPRGCTGDHRQNPLLLADLFFRVGGVEVGKVETCLEINSHHVLADHLWIWRADHGDVDGTRVHVGWEESTGDQGLVVHGDDVTVHALFVEHFQRYQCWWRGERGRTYFYQNELPYDPPDQAGWMAGPARGWAAYKVDDTVHAHLAVALGVYVYFRTNPAVVLDSAIEAPRRPGVQFRHVTTMSLGGGVGTIAHLVNDAGEAARPGAVLQRLLAYP